MTAPQRLVALPFALAALAALGCEHSQPAEPRPPAGAPAPTGTPPLRLTYNLDGDWNPAFTHDGTGILYSFTEPERLAGDRDRCLGLLPAAGGTLAGKLCWRGPGEADSSDVVEMGAESPGGRLAFVAERGNPDNFAPSARALLVGPPRDAENAQVVLPFPSQSPAAPYYLWQGARDLVWLDDSTLVFVAMRYEWTRGSSTGPADTLMNGYELVRLNLRSEPPGVRVYPQTRFPSSVAAGPTPASVVFTRTGDSVVYTLDLASGAVDTLYDFGALGIARDARLVNGRLVAVVGGYVASFPDTLYAMDKQYDQGGPIYLVDLAGLAVPVLLTGDGRTFRRLALSPAGTSLVAESYPIDTIIVNFQPVPVVLRETADLYLIPVP